MEGDGSSCDGKTLTNHYFPKWNGLWWQTSQQDIQVNTRYYLEWVMA